jgi:methylthioribose-1-phosphate isomerase
MHPATITWVGELPGAARIIDQTLLPEECRYVDIESPAAMVAALQRLAVRGAPAIGVAGAFGVLLGVQRDAALAPAELVAKVERVEREVAAARPTAVNLAWGARRMRDAARSTLGTGASSPRILAALLAEAREIQADDARRCAAMGRHGAELIRDGVAVLTHCNAGALATAGCGTALAPIYEAARQGKRVRVFAGETRPLLQGARLTAWELREAGIDVTLITDNMAARVMFERKVDLVLVGSDRIALNGDVCNKIGTYGLAVLAREHQLPFYAVAPLSTFDPRIADGGAIPIEERAPEEVTEGFGRRTAPRGVKVYNPAFDVTPAKLVTGIVTEVGLIAQPDRTRVEAALRRGGVPLA